uniref:Uncharacterized protein n=1 Tax=Physcomitrium patens TaxID=3218 RepID=A0A2K1IHS3_PHYPA|nr:hypothetical protein PHYPA_027510 [Physcomitrium patens]
MLKPTRIRRYFRNTKRRNYFLIRRSRPFLSTLEMNSSILTDKRLRARTAAQTRSMTNPLLLRTTPFQPMCTPISHHRISAFSAQRSKFKNGDDRASDVEIVRMTSNHAFGSLMRTLLLTAA